MLLWSLIFQFIILIYVFLRTRVLDLKMPISMLIVNNEELMFQFTILEIIFLFMLYSSKVLI